MPPRARSLDLALGGYSLYASTLLVFVVAKILGIHSISWLFPVAMCLTIALGSLLQRRSGQAWSDVFRSQALFVGAVVLSGILATLFYDGSVDGRWYHQEGIIRLSEGFNPLHDKLPEDLLPGGLWNLRETGFRITSAPIWINHYPKASEITAAAVFAIIGDMEIAKLFNFLLLISAAGLAHGIFLRLRPGHEGQALAFAIATVSNPVVLSQSWTFYTDGQLYLLLIGMCGFLALGFLGPHRRWFWMAGAAAIGLANTKFTGLVYLAPIVAVAAVWAVIQGGIRSGLRIAILLGGLASLGAFVVGYNPYVRNSIEHGHPFHPVMGNNRIDIIGQNAAQEFETQGRLFKFLQCTWAHSDVAFRTENGIIPPKIPFTFRLDEFASASNPDARVAGFGPFFGGLLLCALVAYGWSLIARLRSTRGWRGLLEKLRTDKIWGLDVMVFVIVLTSIANPEMWWARYVPQLWMVPMLCWAIVLGSPIPSKFSIGFPLTVWIAIVSGLGILAGVFAQNLRTTLIVERDFARMREAKTEIQVHFGQQSGDRLKYFENQIPIVAVPFLDSMSGTYCDTLLYGGIIRHGSPKLQASFEDRSMNMAVRRRLLALWAQHRFLRPIANFFGKGRP